MSKKIITADGTTFLHQSDIEDTEVVLKVASGASFGGGTLTVTARHKSESTGETITFDAALAAGSQYVISLGRENILEAVLSGATTPSITITTDPL